MTFRSFRIAGFAACAVILMVAVAPRVLAIFMIPGTLENVPIERLIANLEGIVAKDARDAQARINLARAHSMAYAVKSDARMVQVLRNARGGTELWFEPGTKAVPFTATPTTDPEAAKAAANHLARAIDFYRQGLELDQTNLAAKLGYGWCLEQIGDRAKAITAYRQVVAEGWTQEARLNARGQLTSGVSGLGTSITSEAAGYLIPLLSLDKDRDEIATLQERIRILGTGPRGITPIVIPLNDNAAPADLVDMSASVTFDADGTGWKKQWTWITPKAAWLVFSPKGARTVDSALQLFGNVTFWMFWQNGYQALQAIDDDDSGALSGPELRDLALWRDANSNGIAEDGEVRTLSESGIVSVNTRYEDTRSRSDYVAFSKEGVTFKDGRTRPTYDVILYGKRKPTE